LETAKTALERHLIALSGRLDAITASGALEESEKITGAMEKCIRALRGLE
jgi:hypothetical protein